MFTQSPPSDRFFFLNLHQLKTSEMQIIIFFPFLFITTSLLITWVVLLRS
ncbi:BnaC03g21910D [Brassica napus]|uniref:BnaC03g21910D protein n=1 Tax=Brassica napus TaxID=3708 RepID=A0A078FNC3_BRANA|nr:BnaC03g21910D [Brassica napus]